MADKSRLLTKEEFMDCCGNIPSGTDVEKAAEPWVFGIRLIKAQDAKTAKLVAEEIEAGLSNIYATTVNPNPVFLDGSQEQFYMARMYALQKLIAGIGEALKKRYPRGKKDNEL